MKHTDNDWKYDEEGYSICPDCHESMNWGDRFLSRNHSPDCIYIAYDFLTKNKLKEIS